MILAFFATKVTPANDVIEIVMATQAIHSIVSDSRARPDCMGEPRKFTNLIHPLQVATPKLLD